MSIFGKRVVRSATRGVTVVTALCVSHLAFAETLESALTQAYQNNPSLNAQRAALRATDESVPIADRDAYAELAGRFGPVALERIDRSRVDGVMFKSLEHGMRASLLHVFDHARHALEARDRDAPAPMGEAATDFCRGSRYGFACGARRYDIAFSPAGVVRLSLE